MNRRRSLIFCILIATPLPAIAQPKANYDEAKVPKYTLPDPLVCLDGTKVADKATWEKKRRPEILRLFEENVYGRSPKLPKALAAPREKWQSVYDGLGLRAEFKIQALRAGQDTPLLKMTMLVYLPKAAKGGVPTFLGLNFGGNHTVDPDPAISIPTSWVRNNPRSRVTRNKANAKSRGAAASRWAIKKILRRGYGLATIYYGDIVPDRKDGLTEGPHRFYLKEGRTSPASDEWGAIAAWAWGLRTALNHFSFPRERGKPHVDPDRVIVIGHSRLGKTALWAGALFDDFAMVISNNSGCGGAALSRRAFGETVKRINTSFPHWFCGNFKKYNDNVAKLPVDQHMLVALIAPRPVYIASAEQDRWADPRGEFLSALHAHPVYRLLGTEGLPAKEMPAVNKPVQGRIGYHLRTGKHDVTDYDWEQYLKFADKHLKRK